MRDRLKLLVTCDEPPLEPLNGNNRKIYEVLRCVSADFHIEALCYPVNKSQERQLTEFWRQFGVNWTFLPRRSAFAIPRAVLTQLSIPTATRDFRREAGWVESHRRAAGRARLLIDFISGAPLLAYVHGPGTILSGHDCMSYLFREESKNSSGWKARVRLLIRRRFALNAERRYAHRAEVVHVVSNHDAAALVRVNPKVNTNVIAIGGGDVLAPSPWFSRRQNVIWGNLASPSIREGVKLFLMAARSAGYSLKGWILIGKVDPESARRLVPDLRHCELTLEAHVDQVHALLKETRLLLLPDVSGTGQKNRTFDGFASGCCVCGLPEVFRGIEPDWGEAFISRGSFAEILQTISKASDEELAVRAARASELFASQFSANAMRARWTSLINSTGFLPLSSDA